MSNHKAKKNSNYKPADYVYGELEIARGDKCVCCGLPVRSEKPPFLVDVKTRRFPVCSEACVAHTKAFVEKDQRFKRFFYYGLVICALLILIGSAANESPYLIFSGVCVAGLTMILFPYPVSYFNSFFACPIRRVTLLTRLIGVAITALGAFFLAVNIL